MATDEHPHSVPSLTGIDGARAWLALVVLVSHAFDFTGLGGFDARSLAGQASWHAANLAVDVFIIISGFVICHMRLRRPEPYILYIARRALRIFPVYLICLGIALLTAPILHDAIIAVPWSDGMMRAFAVAETTQLTPTHLPRLLLAYLTLVEGALPDTVLDQTSFRLLPPAWSLSLEWQFYLVAPFWIAFVRTSRGPMISSALAIVAWVLFERGAFGPFSLPSFLPAAAPYFAIGIATRLALEGGRPAARQRHAITATAGAAAPFLLVGWLLGCVHTRDVLVATLLWMLLVILITRGSNRRHGSLAFLLEASWVVAIGRRSFSVYILHWPLLACLTALSVTVLRLDQVPSFVFVLALGLLLTLLGATVLFRSVEEPVIAFGRRLTLIGQPVRPRS